MTQASRTAPPCIFCAAINNLENEPLVVHRGHVAFVILNKFPYNNGHAMVVPHRHVGRLADLTAEELAEMMGLAQYVEGALTEIYTPHGFNMGLNIGKPAGAGVLDHLHLHIVPRWNGDTSFMTVFGDTRVLPEEIDVTADRLRGVLKAALASESR